MASYWASPNGTGNGLSSGSPFQISDFMALPPQAGDTLNLLDGTYTTGANTHFMDFNSINGTAPQRITIQAVNEGSVLLDGQGTSDDCIVVRSSSFIDFIGINARDPGHTSAYGTSNCYQIRDGSDNIRFFRCIGWDTNATSGTQNGVFNVSNGTVTNFLLEDCAAFGRSRKPINVSQTGSSSSGTLRRCAARIEDSGGINSPTASMETAYNTYNLIVENCITTWDSTNPSGVFQPEGMMGSAGTYAVSGAQTNLRYYGNIQYVIPGQSVQAEECFFWLEGTDVEIRDNMAYVGTGKTGRSGEIEPYDLRNVDAGGNKQIINSTGVAGDTQISSINGAWTQTNFVEGPNLGAVYTGGATLYDAQGQGAEIRYRYQDGVLQTGTELWPFPISDRVAAAVALTSYPAWDINADIQGVFGTFPSGGPDVTPPADPVGLQVVSSGTTIWQAQHEAGNLNEWYLPEAGPGGVNPGGGEFNSGIATSEPSTEQALSGSWSAKCTITTPNSPQSGVRLFRWRESRTYRDLIYGVSYYIPQVYTLAGGASRFYNSNQFKTKNDSESQNDAFWSVGWVNTNGDMKVRLVWNAPGAVPGPRSTDPGGFLAFNQSITNLPIGQWVNIELRLLQSNAFDGQITLWQDGVQLIDVPNVKTSYVNTLFNDWQCHNQWSVNVYSDELVPSPSTVYIDDAYIRIP